MSDEALVGRVRAVLGRFVSHPHSVEVVSNVGHLGLRGPILAAEVRGLLGAVRRVPGVRSIDDRLTVYDTAADVPALQGGVERPGNRFELLQENWSPAARLAAGAVGTALLGAAWRAKGASCALLALAGGGLVARAATNLDFRTLVGARGGRGIGVEKTLNVEAPVERVFERWRDYTGYPRVMSRIREVRRVGDNRWQWAASGPGGVTVRWTSEEVLVIPNEVVEWRSLDGSDVRQHGIARFEPNGRGGTRLQVRLSYLPPGGAIGHAVARLFGADAKGELDADLMRMKTAIETGHPPHDAAQPSPA